MKRVYTENQFYIELEKANVGIDLCEWEDGSTRYVYFEETGDNHSEAFYKNIKEALKELKRKNHVNCKRYF